MFNIRSFNCFKTKYKNLPLCKSGRLRILPYIVFFSVLLGGCIKLEDIDVYRNNSANKHVTLLRKAKLLSDRPYTLNECIAVALENNLNLKIKRLDETINNEVKSSSKLKMLPQLNYTGFMTDRNNDPGSRSANLPNGKMDKIASKSSERALQQNKFELIFSAIDFGLSYFTSIQSADRALGAKQKRIRTAQNLKLDIVEAYYRLFVSRKAISLTNDLLEESKGIEKTIQELRQSKNVSPLKIMSDYEQILRAKQQLEVYRRVSNNIKIEILKLMGVAPWENFKIKLMMINGVDGVTIPSIEKLEDTAIRNRPELFLADAKVRMSAIETKKKMLLLFPNVKLFSSFTKSSNKFLYNSSWSEIGLRSAYNLLNIPSQRRTIFTSKLNTKKSELEVFALTSGIISQVRIAQANLDEVKLRLKLSRKILKIYNSQYKIALDNNKSGGNVTGLELFKMKLKRAKAEIEYYQEFGNLEVAKFRLLNSIGVDSFNDVGLYRL